MYRVELKDLRDGRLLLEEHLVPNVPCGVERNFHRNCVECPHLFLMYRVELKVLSLCLISNIALPFLMHRVELKGHQL